MNFGALFLAIPVAFETAWVLAALAQANHRVHLCSGLSLLCRRRASSSVLAISTDYIFLSFFELVQHNDIIHINQMAFLAPLLPLANKFIIREKV